MTRTSAVISALLIPAFAASASGIDAPTGWHFVGQANAGYELALADSPFGAASALIRSHDASADTFGGLGQSVAADFFAGKRIRLSARIQAEEVNGWSGLWLRIDDGAGKVLLLDNMSDRGIYGTKPWLRQHITVDVPAEARRIAFGAMLSGSGKAWVDDFELSEAPDEAMVTATPSARQIYNEAPVPGLPNQPVNPDFEG